MNNPAAKNHRLFTIITGLLLVLPGCGGQPKATEQTTSQSGGGDPLVEAIAAVDERTPVANEGAASATTDVTPEVSISDDAFRFAAESGRVEKVEAALKAGIDVNTVDRGTQFTALHLAAHEGHLPVIKVLLKHKANVDPLAQNDLTPLHLAAYNGRSECVALLLQFGAKVDPRDREGKTPLTHACTGPVEDALEFEKTVKLLLDAGAEINAKESTEGFTPLMMAAGLGNVEIVKILLRANADKSLLDNDGDSALSHAQTKGYVDIIKLLE
jgi:uncharacterized protein